jgi:DNA primase
VDLDTVEGQVTGLRMAAPVVSRIRDRAMRPEYARRLAGWLGMDERTVLRAVHDAARSAPPNGGRHADRPVAGGQQGVDPGAGADGRGAGSGPRTDPGSDMPVAPPTRLRDVVPPRDPVGQVEMQSLAIMLQAPQLLPAAQVEALGDDSFHIPALQGVWDVMLAAGTLIDAVEGTLPPVRYLEQVLEIAGETVRPLIIELANLDLPARDEAGLQRLARSLLDRLSELAITREYSVLRQRLQRADAAVDPEEYQRLLAQLTAVQQRRRALHARDE